MIHIAKEHGHLPGIGLVCKGDQIEYSGPKRAWLQPVNELVPDEPADRKTVVSELKKLGVKFYKGASLEQLSALLITHKGLVV